MNSLSADPARPVVPSPIGAWTPAWMIAFVALWPLPGLAEAVLVLGALFACVRLLQARARGGIAPLLSVEAWALTSALFAAYWLPQLVSAIDAVDPARAWAKAVAGLRYLPFLWLAAMAVATPSRRTRTFAGLAVVAGLWVVDGLVQAALDTSPLFWSLDQLKWALQGRELCAPEDMQALDRLGGVFGLCNPKLGQVLASLSPFLLFAAGRRFGRTGWLLGAAAAGIVIVLAGSRASWLTYLLVLVFSGWRVLGGRGLLVVMALALAGALALSVVSPQVRARVEQTAQALQADGGGVDAALSGRGRIWGAALCMFREHPVNGVGARGFREAYPACDPAPGAPGAWGEGPALHAHQIVLEILTETGAIGLLLWLAGTALAWRAWRYATEAAREQARPAMLALAVTVFPFNTHLAFYSTFWGGVTLLLAALYAGALLGRTTEAQAAG